MSPIADWTIPDKPLAHRGSSSSMIRWVFFDLGGTLLDDLPFHDYIYGTMLTMFAERGYNVTMGAD
jgi:hypothetical protein